MGEHACNGLALAFDFIEVLFGDVTNLMGDHCLGQQLGARPPGNVEMPDGLIIGIQLIAFRDLAGDTDRSSPDLILKAEILFKRP